MRNGGRTIGFMVVVDAFNIKQPRFARFRRIILPVASLGSLIFGWSVKGGGSRVVLDRLDLMTGVVQNLVEEIVQAMCILECCVESAM